MLSFSNSSFLTKFQQVPGNYENLIKLFEAPAIISEDEGYEAFQINFLLYSREPEIRQTKPGSCFELLRRLLKHSNGSMPLNKDNLVAILTRTPQLLEDLKTFNDNVPEFDPTERELIIAVENSFFRIPTFDFAMVRHEEYIYICTALENDPPFIDRIFLKLTDFPPILEGVLKNFMRKPEGFQVTSLSLPILPSIDTDSLVIQSSSIFENFIEYPGDSEDDQENHQTYTHNSETVKMNINSVSISQPKVTKSNSISPKKPKKSDHPSSKSSSNIGTRQCLNCFCTSTPMWRRGPDGVASLCNACGVKFKAGKLQMSPELVELNKRRIQETKEKEKEVQQTIEYQQNQETFLLQNEELTFHQY